MKKIINRFRKKKQQAKIGTARFPTIDELASFLGRLSFEAVILEKLDEIEFVRFDFDKTNRQFIHNDGTRRSDLREWSRGTAFSELYQVQWEKENGGIYKVIIIDDSNQAFSENFVSRSITRDSGAFSVFLWGVYEAAHKGWHEKRIPKILHYPYQGGEIEANKSPRLKVQKYRDVSWDNDALKEEIFYRFVKLGG